MLFDMQKAMVPNTKELSLMKDNCLGYQFMDYMENPTREAAKRRLVYEEDVELQMGIEGDIQGKEKRLKPVLSARDGKNLTSSSTLSGGMNLQMKTRKREG